MLTTALFPGDYLLIVSLHMRLSGSNALIGLEPSTGRRAPVFQFGTSLGGGYGHWKERMRQYRLLSLKPPHTEELGLWRGLALFAPDSRFPAGIEPARTLCARKLPFGGDQPRSSQSDPPSLAGRPQVQIRSASASASASVSSTHRSRRTPVPLSPPSESLRMRTTFCSSDIRAQEPDPLPSLSQFPPCQDSRCIASMHARATATATLSLQLSTVSAGGSRTIRIRMIPLGNSGATIDANEGPTMKPMDDALLELPTLHLVRVQASSVAAFFWGSA
ncbi:hypothetical protein C8Q74DRAFT_1001570 [Fomes fomentarius]|nr:hypothetical protein C8Q74DRAFT_1001570 [Fomes fomentarius]